MMSKRKLIVHLLEELCNSDEKEVRSLKDEVEFLKQKVNRIKKVFENLPQVCCPRDLKNALYNIADIVDEKE